MTPLMTCSFNGKNQPFSFQLCFAHHMKGNAEIAKLLLQNGAQINFGDSDRETALHRACRSKRHDCIKILLSYAPGWNFLLNRN